jgi:2-methylisocitrate lyase-like PEP mutase family enzyme
MTLAGGIGDVTSMNQATHVATFHQLHASGCFVIPNPWDLGSARLLTRLGFKALATSSAGFAWAVGRQDHGPTLDETLLHLRTLAAGVEVPISSDVGKGFAVAAADVAANVAAAAATGIAGLSIEDSTGKPDAPLFDFPLAVERIAAARRAIDASGTGILLTGRSEGFVAGRPDLKETIKRLTAYADAGADCLHAPGLRNVADIEAIVTAVAPKPVNALVGSGFTTVAQLAGIGVRRISVGGALARVAFSAFLDAATEIAEHGTFTRLDGTRSGVEINSTFAGRR